jgi:hypothetical protein
MALDLENYLEITPGMAKMPGLRQPQTALDGTPAQERMLLVRSKTAPNIIVVPLIFTPAADASPE